MQASSAPKGIREKQSRIRTLRLLARASTLLRSGAVRTLTAAAKLVGLPLELLSAHLYQSGEYRTAAGRNARRVRSGAKLQMAGKLIADGNTPAAIQARLKITPEQYRRYLRKLRPPG